MGGRAPPLVELPKRILVADRSVLGHFQRVAQLVPKQRDQSGGRQVETHGHPQVARRRGGGDELQAAVHTVASAPTFDIDDDVRCLEPATDVAKRRRASLSLDQHMNQHRMQDPHARFGGRSGGKGVATEEDANGQNQLGDEHARPA